MTEQLRGSGRTAGLLLVAFGLLTVAAAPLTWVSARAGETVVARPGTTADGMITLVLGAAVVVCGAVRAFSTGGGAFERPLPVVTLLLGAAVLTVAVVNLTDLGRTASAVADVRSVGLEIGRGLWLTALAGLGVLWSSLLALTRRS